MKNFMVRLSISPRLREECLKIGSEDIMTIITNLPEELAELQGAHMDYLRKLYPEGKVLFGGPFADFTGGFVIYVADSKEEAIKLAQGDPAVKGGLLTIDMDMVKPWIQFPLE